MRPLLTAFGLGVPLLFISQMLISCGSDSGGSKVCNPGDSKACSGPAQCSGTQTCNDAGSGYDTCDCSGAGTAGTGGSASGTGGTSSTGTAGSSSMPAAPLFQDGVGEPCDVDADCQGAPLICVASTSNEFSLGGPQGGYCTLPCTSTAGCQAVDNASACNTAIGYCFALCTPSTGTTKCGADRAQACLQLDPTDTSLGVCIPVCTSDAACGTGRFCDLGSGLCVDQAPPGLGIGEACDPTAQPSACASQTCLQFSTGESFCSGGCTFGLVDTCGYDPNGAAPRTTACIEPQFDNPGAGDIGYCVQICDTAADCAQAADGWICDPLPAGAVTLFGRTGECLPAATAGVAVDAGPG